jgi:hypothetical protein
MRYLEISGEIDKDNQLIIDRSLEVIKPQQVEIDIWFRDDDEEDCPEPTKEEILDSFREGYRDCLMGNVSPLSELWDDIMIQTTGEITDRGQLVLDSPLETLCERSLTLTKPQYVAVVIRFVNSSKYEEEFTERVQQEGYKTLVKEVSRSGL